MAPASSTKEGEKGEEGDGRRGGKRGRLEEKEKDMKNGLKKEHSCLSEKGVNWLTQGDIKREWG